MTVCIAAICQPGMVLGASDRMLTAGDIQFEPDREKIFALTTSIVAMTAGDASLQDELMAKLKGEIERRIETEKRWLTVQEVAELYGQYFAEVKSKKAETAILSPLGLRTSSFLAQQSGMLPSLVEKLATEMINFEIPTVSTIFAGIDLRGAHIYVVDDAEVTCRDSVGFAAIGAGEWHASSQMMFAGHSIIKWFPDTVLSVYAAKKRAEVAPGVGEATDMFIVHELGGFNRFLAHEIQGLESIYKELRLKETTAFQEARNHSNDFIQALITAATPKEQVALPETPEGSSSASSEEEQTKKEDVDRSAGHP